MQTKAILVASDVAGARAVDRGDVAGVELTFHEDAYRSFIDALQGGGHFRFVVQGMVERGPFELVSVTDYDIRVGPHPRRHRMYEDHTCWEHDAFLAIGARGESDAKLRAASFASALPEPRSMRRCVNESH